MVEDCKCTGCCVCVSACPVGCITMEPDELGFLYPKTNSASCINCGKCIEVCPVSNGLSIKRCDDKMTSLAIKNKDVAIRLESSSGGVFSLIAEKVISGGGIVYGAVFDEEFYVVHMGVTDAQSLFRIRGSKISQSDTSSVFKEVKDHLDSNRTVLFTGTPCQVSGLYNYLGKDYDNLFTQDLICHGVCSPVVLRKYLKEKEVNQGAKIHTVCLRNKDNGWRDYSVRLEFDNGTQYLISHSKDDLMRIYLRNYALRTSCYNCSFKGDNRCSDITLADLWGAEKMVPSLDDNKGLSLVICRTLKGKKLIESVLSETESRPINYELAVSFNKSAIESAKEPVNNASFRDDLNNMDLNLLVKKYCKVSLITKLKRIVKHIVR